MENPSAERGLHTEEKQRIHYKKVKGTSAIEGQTFEYKLCALTYIKAINEGLKFKLGCNVEGFGIFDDVVLEYLDASGRTSYICVQLKRKARQTITLKQLLNKDGDFSLNKHYKSYMEIDKNLISKKGVEINDSIDECLFIIYTNADVEEVLKYGKSSEFGQEKFLNAGGSVLQFNEKKHKEIYECMKEKPRYREFLGRYRIMYKQANEEEVDRHIIPPLQQELNLTESEMELVCQYFCDFIKRWWQIRDNSYFLEEKNRKEDDPLQKTSDKVRTKSVEKILGQRKNELDELNIKYKDSAIRDMKQLIEAHKVVLINAPGRSTTFTAAKIHQTLSATGHIILNLHQLVRYKTEVMLAWKNSFNVIVVESDSSEGFQDPFNEVPTILNVGVEKKFIFISSSIVNTQQLSALNRTFTTDLTENWDDWKFTDINPKSRMLILEKKISFQGAEVKLGDIVEENDVGMLNALDCDTIALLLEDEKPSIGIPVDETVEYYIDRRLRLQDIRSHREDSLKRETTTLCKPRTLLDGESRVMLVVDEPGMGKSTLLTHLAKQTREIHVVTWVVRININKYTRILHGKGFGENGATKLLEEAALIKKIHDLSLEGRLFSHTYTLTGNMAVLIDGVDELIPLYTEEIKNLLKILSKTQIKKIWVTSRNSAKGVIQQELQCQSYSLVPFDEKDQKCFLVKFWKKTRSDITGDYLGNLANRVVELSIKQLSVGDKHFMGVPLQCVVLAEMFEENLKKCSTSTTVELPENINVVILCELYVKKKWDIYVSEKKVSDRTNVSVRTDDDALYDIFIENLKTAALIAVLPTNHNQIQAYMTIAEKARKFLQKIEEGVEKTGVIIDVIQGRPIFQHRILAEYFVARWLCDNILANPVFMRDHILSHGLLQYRA